MKRCCRINLFAGLFIGVTSSTIRLPAAEPKIADTTVPFQMSVDNQPVRLRSVKIAVGDDKKRSQEMDDVEHSADIFDTADFGNFDLRPDQSIPTQIVVRSAVDVRTARILPTALGISPTVSGRDVTFHITQPANLTLEINDDAIHSLHIFANPPEPPAPDPHDPNVIYFAPGVHELPDGISVGANRTVYLADGAILKGVGLARSGLLRLEGDHISLRGRGMIDGGDCPTHSRSLCLRRSHRGLIFKQQRRDDYE